MRADYADVSDAKCAFFFTTGFFLHLIAFYCELWIMNWLFIFESAFPYTCFYFGSNWLFMLGTGFYPTLAFYCKLLVKDWAVTLYIRTYLYISEQSSMIGVSS